jgi:hypothetical protein
MNSNVISVAEHFFSITRRVPLFLALWIGAIVIYFTVYKNVFYRWAIPPEIELSFGLATTGSNSSLLDAMLPIPPKAAPFLV